MILTDRRWSDGRALLKEGDIPRLGCLIKEHLMTCEAGRLIRLNVMPVEQRNIDRMADRAISDELGGICLCYGIVEDFMALRTGISLICGQAMVPVDRASMAADAIG